MSYVDRVLQPGETVRYRTRLHWIIYLRVVPFIIVVLLGQALAAELKGATEGVPSPSLPTILTAIGVIGGAIAAIGQWIRRTTTELAVTDRRIIVKRGLIRRHTIEMNMDKVESVDVDQSVFARMLNYGNVTIRGTGSGLEPLRTIEHPLDFRSHVTAR